MLTNWKAESQNWMNTLIFDGIGNMCLMCLMIFHQTKAKYWLIGAGYIGNQSQVLHHSFAGYMLQAEKSRNVSMALPWKLMTPWRLRRVIFVLARSAFIVLWQLLGRLGVEDGGNSCRTREEFRDESRLGNPNYRIFEGSSVMALYQL